MPYDWFAVCKLAPNVCVSVKVPSGDGSSLSPMGKSADRLVGKISIAENAARSAFQCHHWLRAN